jgi:hypothetical protein
MQLAQGRNVERWRAMRSDVEVAEAFFRLVNMTAAEIEAWLDTRESKSVGQDSGDGESIGRKSGRRIIAILGKARGELTAADIAHMRRVVSFINRHMAQRPHKDVARTRWRFSLMNWGHEPLRDPHWAD